MHDEAPRNGIKILAALLENGRKKDSISKNDFGKNWLFEIFGYGSTSVKSTCGFSDSGVFAAANSFWSWGGRRCIGVLLARSTE